MWPQNRILDYRTYVNCVNRHKCLQGVAVRHVECIFSFVRVVEKTSRFSFKSLLSISFICTPQYVTCTVYVQIMEIRMAETWEQHSVLQCNLSIETFYILFERSFTLYECFRGLVQIESALYDDREGKSRNAIVQLNI